MAWKKTLSITVLAVPLIGLGIRGDWPGFAIVLAALPIALLPAWRASWPRWLQFVAGWSTGSLLWGVTMEGFFSVIEAEDYQPLEALALAALFGCLVGAVGAVAMIGTTAWKRRQRSS